MVNESDGVRWIGNDSGGGCGVASSLISSPKNNDVNNDLDAVIGGGCHGMGDGTIAAVMGDGGGGGCGDTNSTFIFFLLFGVIGSDGKSYITGNSSIQCLRNDSIVLESNPCT